MGNLKEKVFGAKLENLDSVIAFAEAELEENGFPFKLIMPISVAVEEIFVNIAHYAYPESEGDMTFGIDVSENEATLVFTDEGVPFDPLEKTDPDITLDAEDREIGGLGIFMVKKTMDDVSYKYEDGKNVFSMTKKINK